jgi:hypothetical protein
MISSAHWCSNCKFSFDYWANFTFNIYTILNSDHYLPRILSSRSGNLHKFYIRSKEELFHFYHTKQWVIFTFTDCATITNKPLCLLATFITYEQLPQMHEFSKRNYIWKKKLNMLFNALGVLNFNCGIEQCFNGNI